MQDPTMNNQDELTPDEFTPEERELERALRTLQPARARVDVAAAALATKRRAKQRRVRSWQAVAASLLLAAGVWGAMRPRAPMQLHGRALDGAAIAQEFVEPPTELTYRRAMMQSPAAFDAALDRHSMTRTVPDAEISRVGVVMFWDANSHTSSGAL